MPGRMIINNFLLFHNKPSSNLFLLLSLLEQKMLEMEMRHQEELETLKQEKGSLQALVGGQSHVISELEVQLNRATGNSTALQRQQQEMMDTVHNLLNLCSKDGGTFQILQQIRSSSRYCSGFGP